MNAIPIIGMELRKDRDLLLVRQRTKHLATFCGLGVQDTTRLVTAVSEIVRNALQYAGHAQVHLELLTNGSQQFVNVRVQDDGPGITNISEILSGNYTSLTGLGKGLLGAKRLVDLFDVRMNAGTGTAVELGKLLPAPVSAANIAQWLADVEETPASESSPFDELQEQNRQLVQSLDQSEFFRQELRQKAIELEIAGKHKSQFFRNLSHELRTPMNAIIGISNILVRAKLEPEQMRLVLALCESGQSLMFLLNDVLDISKIEAGKLMLEIQTYELRASLRGILRFLIPAAEEQGVLLRCYVDKRVPDLIQGDPNRTRQIILNLLSNSIKFSESGEVLLVATVQTAPDLQSQLKIVVWDNGVGIEPEQIEQLFEPFMQASESSSRRYGGTGLGLTIGKQLVDLMGGRMFASSLPSGGSCFGFTIPMESTGTCVDAKESRYAVTVSDSSIRDVLRLYLESLGCMVSAEQCERSDVIFGDHNEDNLQGRYIDVEQVVARKSPQIKVMLAELLLNFANEQFEYISTSIEQTTEYSIGTDHALMTGLSVLVVEDHPVNQMVLTNELKTMGCVVHVANNGNEALTVLENQAYDLIFMDCQMPHLDGYETTRRIRQICDRRGSSSVPIIAMTAHVMPQDKEKCLDAGMNDYIAKPFTPTDLSAIVKRWAPSIETSSVQAPSLDRGLLFGRYSASRIQSLVAAFIEETDVSIPKLERHIGNRDAKNCAAEAHSMKGACNMLFLMRMSQLSKEIEEAALTENWEAARLLLNDWCAEYSFVKQLLAN